ncbi:MAG: GNAT family N-acetyltransferase [Alphaproteobacteria bacterium]
MNAKRPVLTTPRLYMRALGPADVDTVLPLRSDPEAMERMLEGVQDRRAAIETLKNFEAFWSTQGIGMYGVFARQDDRFIGEAGIMLRPDGLGLALRYSFLPTARGRGFAREAVTEIVDFALRENGGLDRIIAVLSDDNKASQALAEDLGFTLEQSFYRGRQKMLVFSLTAEFWRARQRLAEYLVAVKASLTR